MWQKISYFTIILKVGYLVRDYIIPVVGYYWTVSELNALLQYSLNTYTWHKQQADVNLLPCTNKLSDHSHLSSQLQHHNDFFIPPHSYNLLWMKCQLIHAFCEQARNIIKRSFFLCEHKEPEENHCCIIRYLSVEVLVLSSSKHKTWLCWTLFVVHSSGPCMSP